MACADAAPLELSPASSGSGLRWRSNGSNLGRCSEADPRFGIPAYDGEVARKGAPIDVTSSPRWACRGWRSRRSSRRCSVCCRAAAVWRSGGVARAIWSFVRRRVGVLRLSFVLEPTAVWVQFLAIRGPSAILFASDGLCFCCGVEGENHGSEGCCANSKRMACRRSLATSSLQMLAWKRWSCNCSRSFLAVA